MSALIAVETVVLVLLVVLVAGLLRSHAEILRRLHELGAGDDDGGHRSLPQPVRRVPAVARSVTGTTPDGGAVSVALTGSRGMVLLAFLSAGCLTCRSFWEALDTDTPLPHANTRLVVVTKGPTEESPAEIAALAQPGLTVVMSSEAWDDLRVPVSPYFALVDASGGAVVGEGAAASWSRVLELLRQSVADGGQEGPGRRTTAGRSREVDDVLRTAGVDPGDPSLYRPPHLAYPPDGPPRREVPE